MRIKIRKNTTENSIKPENENKKFSIKDAWKSAVSSITGRVGELAQKRREKAEAKRNSDEMLDLSEKLRQHKNQVRLRGAVITGAVLIVVVGYGIYRQVRVFHNYKILSSEERSDDSATEYVTLSKNCILKCNPNGVTCVNSSGEVQWNTTFTMQSPIVDVCGKMVAVADQRSTDVYLFNSKGLVGNFSVDFSITKVKVAKQGVTGVIMEDGEVTWVNLYDSAGNVLVKNRTTMAETGYPMDMDLSSDGQSMIVSYLGISSNNVESRVAFYDFSSVGQDQDTNLVSQTEYEGHIVPEVRFMDNGYSAAFRDDGVTIFKGTRSPEEYTTITLEEEIISSFGNDEYFGIVTENTDETQDHTYQLQLYRENGTRCFKVWLDMEYQDVQLLNDRILINNSSELVMYTTSGKLEFSGSYEKQITEVLGVSGSRKIILATADSTDTIRIR